MHIMLDLETWSVLPHAAIRSIGACRFDPDTGAVRETFYVNIDRDSCVSRKLHICPNTVDWWQRQSQQAKSSLIHGQIPLADALTGFAKWLNRISPTEPYVWGNGANFDNVILATAYRACRIEQPWKYWNDRCYRTLKALHPDTPTPANRGVAHHALDDAKAQAEHCILILQHLQANRP